VLVVGINADTGKEPNERFTVTLNDPGIAGLRFANKQAIGTVVNDDVNLPPFPRPVFRGDPHLVTFDGLAYDFQAVGEFILARGDAGSGVEIQARTSPFGDVVSNLTAIATLVDGHRVTINSRDDQVLRIDGAATAIPPDTGFVSVGAGTITFDGGAYTITDPGRVDLIVQDMGDRLDLVFSVDESLAGSLKGLLGNFNDDTSDDLMLSDGTILSQPVEFADLYGQFADAWRVTSSDSLFDYGDGETTDTYTDLTFPRQAVTLDLLPAALVDWAALIVDEAGITDPVVREAAILDLALTGDLSYLASAAIPVEPAAEVEIVNAPDPLPVLSVAAGNPEQLEGSNGTTSFQFNVYRTGSVSGSLNVFYEVVESGDHPAGVADFGGALPTGFVTFEDGEGLKSIMVNVLGDLVSEHHEGFALRITVSDTDRPGVLVAAPLAAATIVNDDGSVPLVVASVSVDTSGVSVRFNQPLDASTLNLYRTQAGGEGAADVTLTGLTTGPVIGSLVLDTDIAGFRFVKTGAPLAADTYTLTLRSATDGFVDTLGQRLDGDDDGSAGGNYVGTFTVTAAGALLSVADIARGPGQPVNQPATGSGLPITLSNAKGASHIEFTLAYDATLLTVTGVTLGAGAPVGSTLTADHTQAGRVIVAMNLAAPIANAGVLELVRIQSGVPLSAASLYTRGQVLDLQNVSINAGAMPVRADDGVHANAYVGDASADRGYDALDVQQLQRTIVLLDTGFAAYPLLDPVILGDTSGNAVFNSLDASRLQQLLIGFAQTSIPPLPVSPPPLQTFSGREAMVPMSTVDAVPAQDVTVSRIAAGERAGATPQIVPEPAADPKLVKEERSLQSAPRPAAAAPEPVRAIGGKALETLTRALQRMSAARLIDDVEPAALTAMARAEPASDAVRTLLAPAIGAPGSTPSFRIEQPEWMKMFAGGADPAPAANPNAGLRLKVGVTAKAAPALSTLQRH
jgi:hypothetical protein